jgi:hypothetical protein
MHSAMSVSGGIGDIGGQIITFIRNTASDSLAALAQMPGRIG